MARRRRGYWRSSCRLACPPVDTMEAWSCTAENRDAASLTVGPGWHCVHNSIYSGTLHVKGRWCWEESLQHLSITLDDHMGPRAHFAITMPGIKCSQIQFDLDILCICSVLFSQPEPTATKVSCCPVCVMPANLVSSKWIDAMPKIMQENQGEKSQ